MIKNYKETDLYKLGKNLKALGEALTNPHTTIVELIDAAEKLGYDLTIRLEQKVQPDAELKEHIQPSELPE